MGNCDQHFLVQDGMQLVHNMELCKGPPDHSCHPAVTKPKTHRLCTLLPQEQKKGETLEPAGLLKPNHLSLLGLS